ncbi:M56 family metallopeptidase [Pseudoflavonifractor phocaeensis]|uniref:M56 family metallopeptidase n=1 Tax=Pseudoflavonifractor phocaeensis TaxID=1870988 RepID=UPI001957A5C8|nr:M56 family metallopeptidase [Pseudoflavonifractor phocaeensis]
MTILEQLRLLVNLTFCACIALCVLWASRRPLGRKHARTSDLPFFLTCWFIPLYWLLLLLDVFSRPPGDLLADAAFSLCVQFAGLLSLYYLLLLVLLPLLRRWVLPQTCALLWLLPVCLYFLRHSVKAAPRLVLEAPDLPVGPLLLLWLAGSAGVLGWKIFSHLRFRRWLLAEARPVEDDAVLALWWQLNKELAPDRTECYPLVCSPRAKSPLSVGLWSIRVVLPERDYPPDQLALILKHELTHILRRDSVSKFCLTFCTALCWFNPLMWLAMSRSAQDMELSCDEAVLTDADPQTRRAYAGLLLDTAGDARGFTSCLSASASALRYRLKRVVRPARRLAGSLLTGCLLFGLLWAYGSVALAYETRSCADLLFAGQPEACALRSASLSAEGEGASLNGQAVLDYLAGLEARKITGGYTFAHVSPRLELCYDGPDFSRTVILAGDYLICRPRSNTSAQQEVYLVSGGVDWDLLTGLPEAAS